MRFKTSYIVLFNDTEINVQTRKLYTGCKGIVAKKCTCIIPTNFPLQVNKKKS